MQCWTFMELLVHGSWVLIAIVVERWSLVFRNTKSTSCVDQHGPTTRWWCIGWWCRDVYLSCEFIDDRSNLAMFSLTGTSCPISRPKLVSFVVDGGCICQRANSVNFYLGVNTLHTLQRPNNVSREKFDFCSASITATPWLLEYRGRWNGWHMHRIYYYASRRHWAASTRRKLNSSDRDTSTWSCFPVMWLLMTCFSGSAPLRPWWLSRSRVACCNSATDTILEQRISLGQQPYTEFAPYYCRLVKQWAPDGRASRNDVVVVQHQSLNS